MAERNNYIPTNPNLNNNNEPGNEPRTNRPYVRYHLPEESAAPRQQTGPIPQRPDYNLARAHNPETTQPHPSRNGTTKDSETKEVMHGVLTAFSPSSLLSLLNIQKATGNLRLRSGR